MLSLFMRNEKLYLVDIFEAAEEIAKLIEDASEESFLENRSTQYAVIFQFIVIGEAAAKIPMVLRDRYSDIDWKAIVGFRNILVHQYFSLDLGLIWLAATEHVAKLRERVLDILDTEFADS